MNHFQEVIKKVENTAAYIGKKAKDSIEIAKINKDFTKSKKILNSLYAELGRVSYEIHNGITENIDKIDVICEKIKVQTKLVNDLENLLDCVKYDHERIDHTVEDEKTKNIIKDDIPKPKEGVDGVMLLKFCKNCQIGNHPDAKQCISCGHMF